MLDSEAFLVLVVHAIIDSLKDADSLELGHLLDSLSLLLIQAFIDDLVGKELRLIVKRDLAALVNPLC